MLSDSPQNWSGHHNSHIGRLPPMHWDTLWQSLPMYCDARICNGSNPNTKISVQGPCLCLLWPTEIASIASIWKLKLILCTQYRMEQLQLHLARPHKWSWMQKELAQSLSTFYADLRSSLSTFFPEQSTEPVRDFLSKYKIWAGFASPPTWGESQRSKPQPYIYSARYGGIAQCCVFQRLAGVYLCEWWCVLSWIHFSQLYWNIFS